MSFRVVQWATGGVGRAAIEGIVDHPRLQLAGCWTHSREKVGRDAGAIAGCGDTGVLATNSMDEILALDADCLIYSPVFPNHDEVARLLESGLNVVTPTAWFYPEREKAQHEALEAACRKGGSTLHGTGIHPGGFTEKLPLQLSAMQRATRRVRSEEWSDIRTYQAPEVVGEMMMFGKTESQVQKSRMGAYLEVGFYQSIRMVADALSIGLDDMKTIHEYALATRTIDDTPIGQIEPGQVAAQRFAWQGLRAGEPVVEAIVNWSMGFDGYDAAWGFGEGGPRYEVELKGDPDLIAVYHGTHPKSVAEGRKRNQGVVVTAMHCVNSVPAVCGAPPGLLSYLDLPLVTGFAASELRD